MLIDSLATAAGLVVIGLARLVYSIAVGRHAGPGTLGEASVALSAALLFPAVAMFAIVGMQRHVAESLGRGDADAAAHHARSARLLTLILGTVLAGVLWVVWEVWGGIPETLALTGAALVLVQTLYAFEKSFLFAYGLGRRSPTIETWGAVAFLMLLPAATVEPDLLLTPFLAHGAVYVAAVHLTIPRARAAAAPTKGPALGTSIGGYVHSLVFTSLLFGSVLVVGWGWGDATAGLYAASFSIVYLFLFVPRILEQAVFPSLGFRRGQGRLDYVWDTALWMFRGVVVLSALGAGVLVITAPFLLSAVFGPGFADGAPLLQAMAVGMALLIASIPILHVALILDAWRAVTLTSLAQGAVAGAIWLASSPWGTLAVPAGVATAGAVGLVLLLRTAWGVRPDAARRVLPVLGGNVFLLVAAFLLPNGTLWLAALSTAVFVLAHAALNASFVRDLWQRRRLLRGLEEEGTEAAAGAEELPQSFG